MKKPMPRWTKAPEALVALFGRAVQTIPESETRKMFGCPAAFIRGQMFSGLFQRSMFLRLSADDRARFVKEFKAAPLEPMPGRVMREYVVVPEKVLSSSKALDAWLQKSRAYVLSLPPKKARAQVASPRRR